MAKAPHHTGDFDARALQVRTRANADPSTRCWRCGRTLAEHPPHRNGTPAYWTAGHVRDGDPTSPLEPEVSVCNYRHGAINRNRRRRNLQPTRDWYA